MEHTIYLDILFCVNFVVDYILLLTVRRFLSLSCRRRRLLAGAAAGGLLSFVILLPPMPFVCNSPAESPVCGRRALRREIIIRLS